MIAFAIIGCGHIGVKHAELCNHFGTLAAVCDIIPERAVEFGTLYGARHYSSVEEMLTGEPDLKVVVVCTPNGLHAAHSLLALQAGFHVVCEKPMAIEVRDCRKMIAAAEKANRELFIVKQNRFNPAVIAVKSLLEQNTLGKIFSVQLNCFWNRGADYYKDSWHGDKKCDGGILYTQFSHFIDLLYWMIGDIDRVSAYTKQFPRNLETEFEDTAVVCFVMESGALGTMHFTINSFKHNMEGSLTLFAENGTVKIGGKYLNEIVYQEIRNFVIEDLPPGKRENDYGSYKGSMSNHDKVYEHIADVLLNGVANRFTPQEGMKTVEIISKIYASAK